MNALLRMLNYLTCIVLSFPKVLSERTIKDAELLNSRLNKLSAEYESQLVNADLLAHENQSRAAELKVCNPSILLLKNLCVLLIQLSLHLDPIYIIFI